MSSHAASPNAVDGITARNLSEFAPTVTIVGAGRAGATVALTLAAELRDRQPAGDDQGTREERVGEHRPYVALVCRGAARRARLARWQGALPLRVIAAPTASALRSPVVIFATADRDLAAAAAQWQAAGAAVAGAGAAATPPVTTPALATELPAQVWLHLSGAAAPDVLRQGLSSAADGSPAAVGSCHPLAAIPDPVGALAAIPTPPDAVHAGERDAALSAALHVVGRPLTGAFFALAGEPAALEAGRGIARSLGGDPHVVPPDRRAAYHGAAAVVANDLVGLLAIGEGLCATAGLPTAAARPALLHLAQTALDAVKSASLRPGGRLADGLTGAVGRGDAGTLASHLTALAARPDSAEAHRRLSRVLLALVVDAGGLDAAQAAAVADALRSP